MNRWKKKNEKKKRNGKGRRGLENIEEEDENIEGVREKWKRRRRDQE